MQRVLSFQMARGFGETSEFVTKRMCFSFLFSVGFLCLLCGFLLGRFAAHRSLELRAETKRLELAGNGLDNIQHIEHLFLQKIEEAAFIYHNWGAPGKRDEYFREVKDTLSNLSLFIRVAQKKSSILATVRGTREPDRFVILSVNGDGITVALELARILDQIRTDHQWNSRRSLIFCIFFGTADVCPDILPSFAQQRIIAYVAIHNNIIKDKGQFVLSGSNVIQSTVLQAIQTGINANVINQQVIPDLQVQSYDYIRSSDLKLCVPYVAFRFVDQCNITCTGNQSNSNTRMQRIVLAQIVAQTMWRFSECIALRWNPKQFNDTTLKMLKAIENPELLHVKEKLLNKLKKLVDRAQLLNERMDVIETTRSLDIRIQNDMLIDLDKALQCPNKISHISAGIESLNNSQIVLNEIITCYDIALQILQEWD